MINLYNFYTEPKTLPLYKELNKPLKLMDQIHNWGETIFEKDLEPIKHIIRVTPELAYYYAEHIVGGRWDEGEPCIIHIPDRAYLYARDIIGGPWPEAEPYIKQDKYAWDSYSKLFYKGHNNA